MPTWAELEQQAREEYQRLVHQTVKVRRLCGYVGNDSYDFNCVGTVVRICSTGDNEITRRMGDDWIDPVYEVEIISEGIMTPAYLNCPEGVIPRSCWIGGTARNLDGTTEPSDIIEEK